VQRLQMQHGKLVAFQGLDRITRDNFVPFYFLQMKNEKTGADKSCSRKIVEGYKVDFFNQAFVLPIKHSCVATSCTLYLNSTIHFKQNRKNIACP